MKPSIVLSIVLFALAFLCAIPDVHANGGLFSRLRRQNVVVKQQIVVPQRQYVVRQQLVVPQAYVAPVVVPQAIVAPVVQQYVVPQVQQYVVPQAVVVPQCSSAAFFAY